MLKNSSKNVSHNRGYGVITIHIGGYGITAERLRESITNSKVCVSGNVSTTINNPFHGMCIPVSNTSIT